MTPRRNVAQRLETTPLGGGEPMKWRVEYLVKNVSYVDAPTKEAAADYCRRYLLAARVEKTEPVESVPVVQTGRAT